MKLSFHAYMIKPLSLGLCAAALSQLMSCGHTITGQGYAKLVDYDCHPVANTAVTVTNTELNRFLHTGHRTFDEYVTDKNGYFEFDIESSADKVDVFLSPVINGYHGFLRGFHGVYDQGSKEIAELLKTSKDNRVVLYYREVPEKNDYLSQFQDGRHTFRFSEKVRKSMVSVINARLLHLRASLRDGKKTIVLNATKDGELAQVKVMSNRNIEVGQFSQSISLYPGDEPAEYIYYVTYGSKKNAAIIRLLLPALENENYTITTYTQLVPLTMRRANDIVSVDLEGCGGFMRRGVHNRSMDLDDEETAQLRVATRPIQTDPVQEWLDKIDYINTQNEINALINMPGLSEAMFIKLLQYDIMRVELFDSLYPLARDKKWNSAIVAIGKDSRLSESIIIDIINRLPAEDRMTPSYLNAFIRNPSANAAAISAAITVFEKVPRSDSETEYLTQAILDDGLYNRKYYERYSPRLEDIKTIQSFIDARYTTISENKQKTALAFKLRSYPYSSSSLLEQAYFQVKGTETYKYELRDWLNHPNTPTSILSLIAEYPLNLKMNDLGNQEATQKMIAAVLDHPNASAKLRNTFYSLLDESSTDNHILEYYIAPGIARAISNPDAIYKKLASNPQLINILLKNPSLSLELSKSIISEYGCEHRVVNDLYASEYFYKVPAKECYYAALKNDATPRSIKRKILLEYKIWKRSTFIKSEQIPEDTMRLLYCGAKSLVSRDMSSNPFSPEDILWDLLENSQDIQVIEYLAANPGTPRQILERIYNNDYITMHGNNNINRSLSCNASLPSDIRKNLKYSCQPSALNSDIIQQIESRNKSDKPIDCDGFNASKKPVIFPEIEIYDYGIIEFKQNDYDKYIQESTGNKSGSYEVVNKTTKINSKFGLKYGVLFRMTGEMFSDLVGDEAEIEVNFIEPETVATDSVTGLAEKPDTFIELMKMSEERMAVFEIEDAQDILPGKRIIQFKYKGTVLAEKVFLIL